MTSKALEAAISVVQNLIDRGYLGESDVADIIRAFAKNLSEEAVENAHGKVEIETGSDGKFLRGRRRGCAEQIRAAIEKGLE